MNRSHTSHFQEAPSHQPTLPATCEHDANMPTSTYPEGIRHHPSPSALRGHYSTIQTKAEGGTGHVSLLAVQRRISARRMLAIACGLMSTCFVGGYWAIHCRSWSWCRFHVQVSHQTQKPHVFLHTTLIRFGLREHFPFPSFFAHLLPRSVSLQATEASPVLQIIMSEGHCHPGLGKQTIFLPSRFWHTTLSAGLAPLRYSWQGEVLV